MTQGRSRGVAADGAVRGTLVWIDSDEAFIVSWVDGPRLTRVESDVPLHHRSTGHVRIDPVVRHGGGREQAVELHRIEHLHRYVQEVAAHIAPEGDVEILGTGTVREHLARLIQRADHARGRVRTVRTEASPALTTRQLIARLRELVGERPRRQLPGPAR